ncbi:ABC transporter ATP-binding protein [Proteiniclasticum sp.]|uniref:ABC transporter ATP-binding protein n=1 Tax=Proteiniclasticum sp. TaxID=2053595 RepID=UPI0028A0BFE6|nr:ABC transporter ATP-binding protein [Proteiniclasticum sp.]
MKLKLENIQKSFDNKEVLKDITFEFEKGKIYALLGRNGAGKTTLFNILADEIREDSGSVSLVEETGMRSLEIEDLSYVYSSPVLPDFLTGYEFIRFFMDINKDKIAPEKTIDDYFDLIKIDREDRHRLIKGYSHGMKNKVQMLLFLIAKPPVILLDEPLTSLDVVVALEIKRLLRSIREDHIIIFSTHILQLATDLCDEIVILSEGKLSLLDHDMLSDADFEEEIMTRLKEGTND